MTALVLRMARVRIRQWRGQRGRALAIAKKLFLFNILSPGCRH
jgi:hypothetical protein